MEDVKVIIENTITSLFSHFNYGRSQSEKMMHFCRPAVEKFVFSKVYETLFSIYEYRYREFNAVFYTKSQEILSHPITQILDYLEVTFTQIKSKFRLTDDQQPYITAIKNLNKLESYISPIEKINCLLTTSTAMRTEVVDYYKGKVEISTMDDELPVLIYIYIHSSIKQLASELHFLKDYIANTDRFDNEQRLLTNMEVILQYVNDEWHWPS